MTASRLSSVCSLLEETITTVRAERTTNISLSQAHIHTHQTPVVQTIRYTLYSDPKERTTPARDRLSSLLQTTEQPDQPIMSSAATAENLGYEDAAPESKGVVSTTHPVFSCVQTFALALALVLVLVLVLVVMICTKISQLG